MKGCTVGALVLVCVALATGLPAKDALIQEMVGDTAVVESTIREVRAAPSGDSHEEGICTVKTLTNNSIIHQTEFNAILITHFW